ncbi:hypothetical protein IC582_004990 [Cucumis melo]
MPQIDSANLVAHDEIQPNTAAGGVLNSKSTWASLFGTAAEGSLLYTPPKVIGDKIVVIPTEEVIDQGIRVWENSLVGQLINAKLPYSVIQRLVEKIWGKIEMPIITILENDLICFQFRRSKLVEWILSRGPWHLGGKPMLLRKWTPVITEAGLAVVASAVGKPISLDLATKERHRLSYARVCVELEGGSNMPSEITVNLRGVEFNVSVNYEWKPWKCNLCGAFGHSSSKCSRSEESKTIQEEVVHKGEDVYSEPCGEVVLEAFKQLEEGEINNTPNRHNGKVEKGVGKRDGFTLVTRKKSELVSIRDRGKSMEVIMPNSFGSLLEVGDADKWALSIIEGSLPPLQVDEGTDILSGMKSKAVVDFLGSSSVGFYCLLETRVREVTVIVFVTGTLTDLLSGVCGEVFCVYASNSNIERRLLWRRLVEITSAWSRPGVVMGDFNAIRVHSEAFGGSPIQGEMEDFDLAIRDADLVEPQCRETGLLGLVKFRGLGCCVVRNAKAAMDIAQREVERNPMSDVLSHQAGLATETFWTAVILEEASLRQKSRIRWLKLGDQNTTFFHRSVRSRMSRNTLRSLVDSDGTRVSSHDGVAQMAVNYFSNSLGSQVIGYRELSPFIDDIVQFEWSEECCQALQLPIMERPRVLTDSAGFFKGAWSVVGEDFCDAVLHFFETCYLPVGVNATTITLIPKHNGAERLKDFRPISCCNVLCKCISKILADRLRVWLPSFISSNQSAFVLGRSIIENILLCQELVGGYHLNSGKPRCTLKVDLQKAYDSVNWDFLFGLLIAIGTPLKFVSWIRACVTSTMFSIMINGSLKGFFHGRKGVRQGVNNENASHLAACMGFVRGNLPVRYLGLPLLAGRLCSNDYAPLIHRITSRIRSWTTRVLSFAGRLQLVRFVLRSLQVYWASVFVLPAYVHHEVDKILRSYLWRGKEEGRGGIKVAWVDVCLPFEEGGLGIRDGPSWNIASTLKILWLMLTNSGSLWVAWVEAYILKGRSVWDVDSRVGRSWYLRAILRKREKLKHLVRMKVGNGNSCRVWLDSWLPGGAILEQVGERVMYDAASRREARLSDFIDPDGEWLWPRVSLDLIDLWERVQEVSPCLSVSDSWVWVPGHQGGFSIASAWEAVRPRGGRVLWDGLLWGGGNIPKHSFCAWLAIKDRLGTRDRLHRWDSSVLLSCILCQGGMESRDHLFFSCSFGGDVWSRVLRIMASSHRIGHWGVELFWICHQGIGKGVRRKLWRVLWCATIYFIWNERNHRLHGGQAHDPIVIFHLICSWIRARAGSWREDAHLPF